MVLLVDPRGSSTCDFNWTLQICMHSYSISDFSHPFKMPAGQLPKDRSKGTGYSTVSPKQACGSFARCSVSVGSPSYFAFESKTVWRSWGELPCVTLCVERAKLGDGGSAMQAILTQDSKLRESAGPITALAQVPETTALRCFLLSSVPTMINILTSFCRTSLAALAPSISSLDYCHSFPLKRQKWLMRQR